MKKIFLPMIMIIFTMILCVNVPADLGNFNDYGGGGSGGGYSSGGGHSSSGRHHSTTGSTTADFIILIVIVVVVAGKMVIDIKNGNSLSGNTNTMPADNTADILAAITKNDPQFSNALFTEWVKNVFIALQTAWSNRDMSGARPFEKEELFRQHQLQLQEYINNGRINVIDKIDISHTHLFEYKRDNQYESLTVFLKCSMIDYIKDEKTGKVLKGSPEMPYHLAYLLTFMRKSGVKTDPSSSNRSTEYCPNCGAPCKVTSSGQCEYCGSVITTGDFDWVLSDIQGVKHDVKYGSGGVKIYENNNN